MYHGSQTFGCEVEMTINYNSARYQLVLHTFNMHCFTNVLLYVHLLKVNSRLLNFYKKGEM